MASHVRPLTLTLVVLLAVSLLSAVPVHSQEDHSVGINRNFVEPEVAHRRQVEHNHFFLPKQILDLQTSAYATKQRPAGLTYDVYSAIGYGLATSMMVVGPRRDADGHRRVIIIDTLEDRNAGVTVAKDYIALYKKHYGAPPKNNRGEERLPIDAIIYTHNHIDHTGGVLGYLEVADKDACPAQDTSVTGLGGSYTARRNCVEIICQEKVVDAVINTSTVSGRMIQARSFYMYGLTLPEEPVSDPPPYGQAITNGIGPSLTEGISGFHLPSRTFAEQMWLTAAGVHMEVVYVPSETNDELAVFVPDAANGASSASLADLGSGSGLLFSAEVIQGPAFPNLYSLRGTQFRSPATWYASVDRLREYDSWCMVPSHGPPLCQRDNIELLLRSFRDAVQFTHDQTLRFMNKGYTPDELVELVKVPEEVVTELAALVPWQNSEGNDTFEGLVHPEDYLLPFYGSVAQSAREIYAGYLGWFEGDPVHLSPTPPKLSAERMSQLIAKKGSVLKEAAKALKKGEYQWAAELASIPIRVNPDDMAARKIKAEAFVELGRRAINPNWSDWYFTSANELLTPPGECFRKFAAVGLVSAVTQTHVPVEAWVNQWTWRLDGQRAALDGADNVMGFWIAPTTKQDFGAEGYVLELRHGIAQFTQWSGTQEAFLDKVSVAVEMSQNVLDALVVGEAIANAGLTVPAELARILEAIAKKKIRLMKGTEQDLKDFFQYFDPLPTCEPPVTVPRG